MKATEMLKQQHREVEGLFKELKSAGAGERAALLERIEEKLQTHMQIEEDIFYPAVREQGTKKADEIVPEAYEEHAVVKLVLGTIPDIDPEDERFEAKMTVLEELIEHHVEEEEKEMFKIAEKLGAETLEELASQMKAAAAGEDMSEDDDDEDTEDDDAEASFDAEDEEPADAGQAAQRGSRRRR